MRIETIAIGSELLNAGRMDTNSIWIASRLAELGLELNLKTCIGDSPEALKACIASALHRSDMIIATGGLGPTFDDITKEAFSEIIGVPLHEDPQIRSEIDLFFQARGRKATVNNYKQALIPQGAVAIHNPLGTAPGVYWEGPQGHAGCRIVMLPGVPKEMMAMWERDIHPRISALAGRPLKTLRLVVSGVGESVLDERTRHIRERHSFPQWTILAPKTHIEFLVRSESEAELKAAQKDIEQELGADLICIGEGRPESVLLDMLCARGETLALAESVTGGILASRLAGQPGASRSFIGGAVAYTPKAKAELIGIPLDFINANGTVGQAITREMAARIRNKLGATWGIAITGNAGPAIDEHASQAEGADKVGRCYIALAGPPNMTPDIICNAYDLHGDRGDIQLRASSWAIDTLRRTLIAKGGRQLQ
ncbi:MAG: CinA family nicotinamide mononucleotide deamidase-related protein [Holophagaceae bacterium]|nr:CinA family nicotinamide mononucleotide deamidase-related protein [Holophagaceae bacterium]